MNLIEATREAMRTGQGMTRFKERLEKGNRVGVIKPGNSHDACGIASVEKKVVTGWWRNWNPTADDLMADDWELVEITE